MRNLNVLSVKQGNKKIHPNQRKTRILSVAKKRVSVKKLSSRIHGPGSGKAKKSPPRRGGRQEKQKRKRETGDLKTKSEIRKAENRTDPQMTQMNAVCHRGTETQSRLKTITLRPLQNPSSAVAAVCGRRGFLENLFSFGAHRAPLRGFCSGLHL
jgi:hypothetical protein